MSKDTTTEARVKRQRKAGAQRQQRLRAERARKGHTRREYWATAPEHAQLAEKLKQLRGQDDE